MLSFQHPFRFGARTVRREFLRVGGLGLGSAPLWFSPLNALADSHKSLFKDRSVVFLFMHGGPSQYETFDPKMEAPSSIRSATGDIATSLAGVRFGSTMKQLAERAHLLSIVRSFVTGDGNHDIKPVMGKDSLRANLGSLYSRVVGPMRTDSAMPSNVALFPRAVDAEAGPAITSFGSFESAGELGAAYAPFVPALGDKTGAGLQQDLKLTLPQTRLEDRRSLLTTLDTWKRRADSDANIIGSQACAAGKPDALLSGVADAFGFSKEPPT
ncbi:MAG: DUF1501 domain-containing protein [Pirellulales bacterium]